MSDQHVVDNPPKSLSRLAKRGLEIRLCEDLGPHKKYFAALDLDRVREGAALVTADDDTFYPRGWLLALAVNAARYPGHVVAHRAYRVSFDEDGLAPYATWPHARQLDTGPQVFPTGMGGVLYPAVATDKLRAAGRGFTTQAPRADDVWIHSVTSRAGIPGLKIGADGDAGAFLPVRAAGEPALAVENVQHSGNDSQIRACYSPADVSMLRAETASVDPHLLVAVLAESKGTGGAEKFITRLASSVHAEGVASILVGEIAGWRGALEVPAHLGPKWQTLNLPHGFARLPLQRHRVRRILASVRPDVVHCHFKREQVGFTGAAARIAPVVWTEHGRFPRRVFGAALRPLYHRASRNVAAVASVSKIVDEDLRALVKNEQRLVIENGIDLSHFRTPTVKERSAARRRIGVSDQFAVAVVGRLDESKRPALAMEASVRADASVIVAGTGPLGRELRERFDAPRTHFLGQVDDPRDVYWAADALIFASDGDGEGAPTVILEAAACGLPIVATTDSGFADWATELGGVGASATVDAIANALVALLRANRPVDRATPAGDSEQLLDISGWAKKYSGLYRRVAERGSSV
ncbi:glycosyltransferase family 4 protein [Microbacterium ureisolvens]|uniref:D-inositol 3-phosphate glycosyltransferase n=1 Tax=Microbacterium ureisolvens TaxID=2781186 RepID=A0ABS7I5T8_9MICO|nr:glycosyltransferase family 4 protein [Microbacterium ureisolvens]MBW9111734.1 glycosyltransferase family 4 protein [Microbacterium ureisolvens]